MKKLLFILLVLVSASVAAKETINLRNIGFDEIVEPGQDVPIFVGVRNVGSSDLDDLHVTITSFDLDVFELTKGVEVDEDESAAFVVPMYIPMNSEPGHYTLRIVVSTDDEDDRRVYFRGITLR